MRRDKFSQKGLTFVNILYALYLVVNVCTHEEFSLLAIAPFIAGAFFIRTEWRHEKNTNELDVLFANESVMILNYKGTIDGAFEFREKVKELLTEDETITFPLTCKFFAGSTKQEYDLTFYIETTPEGSPIDADILDDIGGFKDGSVESISVTPFSK